MKVKCSVCDEEFESCTGKAEVCSNKCRMRKYRETEKGQAKVAEYNKRYKRVDLEWICQFPECGKMVISAHKRTLCDEHSNPSGRLRLMKKRRPEIIVSYNHTDSLRKKIKRGTIDKPVCVNCGEKDDIHFHHPDYSKPKSVIPLCRNCHIEEHRKYK